MIILTSSVFYGGCKNKPVIEQTYNLVPIPESIVPGNGEFKIIKSTKVLYTSDDQDIKNTAEFLVNLINSATGYELEADPVSSGEAPRNTVFLSVEPLSLSDEGYKLTVSRNSVTVRSSTPTGIFWGIQTLRQLLPVEIESLEQVEDVAWVIPAIEIVDEPRYSYRGLHLDVGRHFFPVEFIKRYIDLMALHKLNYFHWHLTEDQGWRIEIKKYPKLTEVGAYRKESMLGHYRDQKFDGTRYGGFYTQDEIKDVVAYAGKLNITVIPEIELPGHSMAALASYPELGCTGGPYEVGTKWGVIKEVYCAGNDQTFQFLEDVLTEVIELFPGKYIHIGGDECPKERWIECKKCQARIKEEGLKDEHELQSYFIKRIETFLNSHGKKLIGWDEILEGGLAPEATVMSWRGIKGGIEAAKQHHEVIMTPTDFMYFDYYQAPEENEPLAIGGFLSLEKVYSYEPAPDELDENEVKYILGAQGNVWTEYMKTVDYVEYMVYPRACALSEITWSQKDKRNYDDFLNRLEGHLQRLDLLGVNYRPLDKETATETSE